MESTQEPSVFNNREALLEHLPPFLEEIQAGQTKELDAKRPLPAGFKKKYGEHTFNGLPYRGKVFNRKEKDPDQHQPVLSGEVFTKQFNLGESGHIEEWNTILQKVNDGIAEISFEERIFDKDLKTWHILVRWIEYFYTNPEGV